MPTLSDWPLRERVVVESLQAWAGQGRKLTLIAHRFDAMARLHPRFVTWRNQWDHIIDCRVCKQVDESEFPECDLEPRLGDASTGFGPQHRHGGR